MQSMHRSIRIALAGAVLASATALTPVDAESALAPTARYVSVTPWVVQQEDPADALYRDGRRALNRGDYREAARLFARIHDEHPTSARAGDSYYYEAIALSRMGGNRNLALALELLGLQENDYPGSDTRDQVPSLRTRIQSALAQRGDRQSAESLRRQADEPCNESDQEVRLMALSALINMDSDRAVPILEQVLRNRDECSGELREQAVFLISQHMGEGTVEILLDLARNDPDEDVREQAVFWLSQVHTDEALNALESILRESDDEDVQENAIFAISQHGSARATAILKDFAERPDAPEDLRENAIFWLGQSEGGGEYLRELYDRIDSEELKENIVFGIAQSNSAADRTWLMDRALDESESIEVRKNALFWAGQTGIEVSRLAELYESVEDSEMKEQVIFVLSQHHDERDAVTQLMRIFVSESDAELKENILFWLGQSHDPRVPDFLLGIIG